MATITDNGDGTLTVTLTEVEIETKNMLDDLATMSQYLTLWIKDHGRENLHDRFSQLTQGQRATVIGILRRP